MWKKIKKDWDACWTGILIVALLWVVTALLGRGMCIFKAKWGVPCPGCGLTRSILLILQGKWSEAWEMHPFGYGWLVFFVIFFVDRYVIRRKEYWWKVSLVLLGAGMLIRYIWVVCCDVFG